MLPQKRDLEIIFNLQWKYGPKVAERSNIVGVYDVPTITLSWEPFKSYILKNSGTPGGDVRVSYFEDGRETPIHTTLDFQKALYTFRKKAMRGEIINLMLERLSIGFKSRISPTCDAQTECTEDYKMEKAPEWFSKYMTDFKKEILSEMSTIVTSHVAAVKPVPSYSHYPRKSKTECSKRCRKAHHHHHHDVNEKEVLKTMKMEKKLETKMEKLVNKSKKLKDKKLSLITKSSDSDAGHSSSKSNSEIVSNVESNVMNAAPVRTDSIKSPHFIGGEVYHHSWEVINNGSAPWTKDTELHFSWGSSLLQPIQRVIPCPHLKPMETGQIEAMVHVPKICGKYQMYWHFYHRGRKFGHWLGCEIIVDKVNSAEQLSTTLLQSIAARYKGYYGFSEEPHEHRSMYGAMLKNPLARTETSNDEVKPPAGPFQIVNKMRDLQIDEKELPQKTWTPGYVPIVPLALNMSPSKIQIIENYMDPISNRKSKDREIDNLNDSMDGNRNVDVESDGDSHSESISKIDEDTSSNSTLNDMVILDIPDEEEEQENAGYAYVMIDGVKTPVPKKYLRTDFLESAEDAPEPKNDDDQACAEKELPSKDDERESNSDDQINKEFYVVNKDFDDIPKSTDSIPPDQHGSNLPVFEYAMLSPLRCPVPVSYMADGPNISPWPSDYLDLLSEPAVLPGNNTECTFELAPHMKYFTRTPVPPSGPDTLLDFTPEQSPKSENRVDCSTPQKSQRENDLDDTPEQSPRSANLDRTPERAPRSRTYLEYESPRSEDCSPEKAYRPESFLNRPFAPDNSLLNPLPRWRNIDPDLQRLGYDEAYEDFGPYFAKMKDESSSDSDLPVNKQPDERCSQEDLIAAVYRFKILKGSKPVASNSSGSVDAPKDDVTPPLETPPLVTPPLETPRLATPPLVVSPSSVEPNRVRNIPEAAVPITSVMNDAITIASSAFKNLVSKINPPKNEQELGRWVNGHWVPTAEDTIRGINLKKLEDMGFENRDLNATLLARYNDDLRRVVTELVM